MLGGGSVENPCLRSHPDRKRAGGDGDVDGFRIVPQGAAPIAVQRTPLPLADVRLCRPGGHVFFVA